MDHGWLVRLWIDDPAPIGLLAPDCETLPIEVCQWEGDFTTVNSADVVIEAFACELPPRYVTTMSRQPRLPVWLNLEYLSAENWVTACHGLPSPQPVLAKYFFFPGFVHGTGGLLKERNLPPRKLAANSASAVLPAPTSHDTLEVSLFCYENPALPHLLESWRDGQQHVICHVAAGLPRTQVANWLGKAFAENTKLRAGHLTLQALPFLPQVEYDALLARCQLNFVRGEDSFVQAQWAERPFVWQAYPQAENAHRAKLDAFLDRYLEHGDGEINAVRDFMQAWNGKGAPDWPAFATALPAQAKFAPRWAAQIEKHGDLAANLVKFCSARL